MVNEVNVKCVGERKAGPGLEGSRMSCAKLKFILETMENHLNFLSRSMRSLKCEFLCFRKVTLAIFVEHDRSKNSLGRGFLFSFLLLSFPPSFLQQIFTEHPHCVKYCARQLNPALKETDSIPEPTCY